MRAAGRICYNADMKEMKKFLVGIVVILLLAAMTTAMFAACVDEDGSQKDEIPPSGEQGGSGEQGEEEYVWQKWNSSEYAVQNVSLSKVGFYAEYLGTVSRKLPQVSNGGLAKYPEYGVTAALTAEEKQAILDENAAINAGSAYTAMDANGYLYLNGVNTGKKLYKHTASAGMYEGDVSDDEPAIVKRITMTPHLKGNNLTGLYAPAGEVVTIELSDEDLAKTGGLIITIGQAFAKGNANNIWAAREFNRMPNVVNTMRVSENIGYVGSFLGGPIYIEPVNKGEQFTVTISGAVAYSHYIYGYTTSEEFEMNSSSTAPYFDLEVWDDGVRHSGPKSRAQMYDYTDLTRAAELWQKIALVSNKTPVSGGCFSATEGITFLYDPFIAAGSMVAFVNHNGTNCPLSAMTAALDAQSAVTNPSGNFWGVIHEYNHNYQAFGMEYGDYGGSSNEVTNNVINIVEYSLFSSVSSLRSATRANGGTYADGWNRYTNPEWVLRQTISASGRNAALDAYVNLINSFGQEIFMRATNVTTRNSDDAWFASVSAHTGYNMNYYMKELLQANISDEMSAQYSTGPMYVPVASVYQTGAGYLIGGEKHYSRTAVPYVIEEGEAYTLDFNQNLVMPAGFTWKIKSLSAPANGSLEKIEENVYRYTPSSEAYSGKMYLRVQIVKDDGAFEVDDAELVIELMQGHPKKDILTRTVYTYTGENMYSDAQAAYEAGFAGYETCYAEDNTNRVKNGNFEVWEPSPSNNAVMVVEGKYIAPEDGKYRIALRGRQNVAMYISLDGINYALGGVKKGGSGADFYHGDPATYTDMQLSKGDEVYIKAVLLVKSGAAQAPYIGVGVGKFTADGSVSIGYMNAVRQNYAANEEYYDAPYLYTPQYTVTHNEIFEVGQRLVSSKYSPWDNTYGIENLFDGNDQNFIHSDRTSISAENPFEVTAELESAVTANSFTIIGEPSRQYQPKDFKLYGGMSEESMTLLADVTDAPKTGSDVTVHFSSVQVKYFKLVVTDTHAAGQTSQYIAFRAMRFGFSLGAGELLSPASGIFTYRGEWSEAAQQSAFGKALETSNGSVTFTVGGTFALLASGEAEIYVDGEKVQPGSSAELTYYVILPSGEHEVTVGSGTNFKLEGVIIF